eukprot:scaffold51168_cov35-Tisochrysis_lutea.AAC.3
MTDRVAKRRIRRFRSGDCNLLMGPPPRHAGKTTPNANNAPWTKKVNWLGRCDGLCHYTSTRGCNQTLRRRQVQGEVGRGWTDLECWYCVCHHHCKRCFKADCVRDAAKDRARLQRGVNG